MNSICKTVIPQTNAAPFGVVDYLFSFRVQFLMNKYLERWFESGYRITYRQIEGRCESV